MSRRLPPLNALRAFEAAARLLSFTKAADELHVTQAAVSHQIKGLEEWLGVPLFRRVNRGLVLTDAGQTYLPPLREALDLMASATERVIRKDATGTLTISTMPSFAAKWLVLRLGRFQATHPELDVRLHTTSQMVDFNQQDVDVAIRFGSGNWPELRVERLLNEDIFPVCCPSLLPTLATPADLKKHTLLHDDYIVTWGDWLALAGVDGLDATRGLHFTDSSHTIQAAMEGHGVALARQVLAADDLAAGRLARPFGVSLSGLYAYYFVAPAHYFQRPKVKAFREWLFAEVEEYAARMGLPERA